MKIFDQDMRTVYASIVGSVHAFVVHGMPTAVLENLV